MSRRTRRARQHDDETHDTASVCAHTGQVRVLIDARRGLPTSLWYGARKCNIRSEESCCVVLSRTRSPHHSKCLLRSLSHSKWDLCSFQNVTMPSSHFFFFFCKCAPIDSPQRWTSKGSPLRARPLSRSVTKCRAPLGIGKTASWLESPSLATWRWSAAKTPDTRRCESRRMRLSLQTVCVCCQCQHMNSCSEKRKRKVVGTPHHISIPHAHHRVNGQHSQKQEMDPLERKLHKFDVLVPQVLGQRSVHTFAELPQSLHLDPDARLTRHVVVLDAVEKLVEAPERVCLYRLQGTLWQMGHIEQLRFRVCCAKWRQSFFASTTKKRFYFFWEICTETHQCTVRERPERRASPNR